MAKLKSSSIKTVTIRERDFLLMHENTMMMEALILAGIKDMPIYKAMERILKDQHIEVHVKPLSSRYSFKPEDTGREQQ